METNKLISMVDFVLQCDGNKETINDQNAYFSETVINYAKFLKQPLKLGMFVPVDDNGNILVYPVKDGSFNNKSLCEYEKAYSKVLFEGFDTRTDMYKQTKRTFVEKESLRIFLRFEFYSGEIKDTLTDGDIESLIKHNLTLIETAKKQIQNE